MNDPSIPETPVLVKRADDARWPEGESMFYLLSRDGLFVCRNHRFFRSCAPARSWPAELASQEVLLEAGYPRLTTRTFERVVGFFSEVAATHGSEAAALLVWDETRRRPGVLVPRQEAETIRSRWSPPHATGLHYFPPTDLGPDRIVYGDIHSHVDFGARPSTTDIHDESHRAGLHIIVGRISREPPEIHVEAVVDGERFELEAEDVVEGYGARRTDFPPAWMDKVKVTVREPRSWPSSPDQGRGSSGNGRVRP
jgi:hypothetical protein